MGRRRIEMFQYRQVLVRLRQGDTDRQIARSKLMGRIKVGALRALAQAQAMVRRRRERDDNTVISAKVIAFRPRVFSSKRRFKNSGTERARDP